VRQAVGIEAKRQEYDQVAIVTNVALTLPHNNTAYERFTESGPLALLPMSNQRMAVVWSVRAKEAESLLALPDDAFLLKLQERFGERLGAFARVGKRAHYPLALTKVAEHARERLVLIGNAAHTVHPVAGQGFNLGLRDVAALAEVLSEALKAGEDIGSLTVLQRYRAWRQRDNQVISGFTHGLISTFSNDFPPFAFARNAALAAVDLLPGAKRALIRITSGLAGKLPKLARGLPL
jgi:2-octaprenyl-6-methoxyphenol hydroxylase